MKFLWDSDRENDSPSIKSFFRVTQNLFLASKNLTKLRINDFNFLEENPGKSGWDVNIHTKTRVNVHVCQENLPSLVTSNWTSHMATQDSSPTRFFPLRGYKPWRVHTNLIMISELKRWLIKKKNNSFSWWVMVTMYVKKPMDLLPKEK